MIHLFRFKDLNIVTDTESGAVHLVSGIVYNMLSQSSEENKSAFQRSRHAHTLKKRLRWWRVPGATDPELSEAAREIDELIRDGLLFAKPLPENAVSPELREPVIKAMCLHIAHDCNMRCAYCFAGTGEYSGARSLLSASTGKNAIDFLLANSGERRNLEIDFFGGEPLMNFGVVRELVQYGRMREKECGKHIRFTLTTNGLLLDDEITAFLNEHMDNVILSIDGRPDVNDRMRQTVNGAGTYHHIIDKLLKFAEAREKAGKLYYVRGTYTAHNKDFAADIEHLAALGFANISVEPVVAPETEAYALTEADLPELLAEYDRLTDVMLEREQAGDPLSFFHFNIDLSQGPCVYKRAAGCGAGTEYVAVAANGDLYPCHQFVGEPAYLLGNVNDFDAEQSGMALPGQCKTESLRTGNDFGAERSGAALPGQCGTESPYADNNFGAEQSGAALPGQCVTESPYADNNFGAEQSGAALPSQCGTESLYADNNFGAGRSGTALPGQCVTESPYTDNNFGAERSGTALPTQCVTESPRISNDSKAKRSGFENRLFDLFNTAHIYRKPACRECWAKYWCSGGCHANAIHMNGDIRAPYKLGCALERKRLECAIGLVAYRSE